MLTCNSCKSQKEKEYFVFRSDRPNKYRNICKECYKTRQRERYYERKKVNPFIFKHQKLSSSAKTRKIPYDLTPEFLKGIWTGFCPVSGEEIFISTSNAERTKENAAEIDRFIPELGYVKGNVTWVSRKFNRKKLDSSLEELKQLVSWLETHKPLQEAYAEIEKPGQLAWNKGKKMPNSTPRGESNPSSRLTEEKVYDILEQYTGERGQITQLARQYEVSPATIRKIVKRETWKHLGK